MVAWAVEKAARGPSGRAGAGMSWAGWGKTRHSKMPTRRRRGVRQPPGGGAMRSMVMDCRGSAHVARLAALLVACLGAGLPAWSVELAPEPARGARHGIVPRPDCEYLPQADPARLRRLPPRCLGPLHGARAAPRRRLGRQQWRMRRCNAQARWRDLRGEQRESFLRDCLHRGR